MATMTAQLLIGSAHPYDGGIYPDYYMYLSENGVARWTIIKENISSEHVQGEDMRIAQWIPTIEYMLEDALLMIGIYILKDEELVKMAKQIFNGEIPKTAALYEEVSTQELEKMRERVRQINHPYKMTLSIFQGSTIMKQVKVLEAYPMDVELCLPVYLREYNTWSQKQETKGELESRDSLYLYKSSEEN